MGTSVLSYSGVDIGTGTGVDQALKALPNSELPIEDGDWQGGSSSSFTPQVADMTPRTDSEEFWAQFESVRGVLPLYSSAPPSTDDYTSARNSEAPVLAPTSTDGQGIVSTAEPLIYTSIIDSTPEAPMLVYSSSPALSNFENGHNTIDTISLYSTAALDSMSLVDQDAEAPSSDATEHKVLSYSLISDSAGTENKEAPFYTSGADDSRSKGPGGQSDSRHTEALFSTDDVEVPFYTATEASDSGAQNKDPTLATSASTIVSSSNLTNPESFGNSSPQASSDPVDRDAFELSTWLSTWNVESAENVTTETDPRCYRFDNPPVYDCSTQTYHHPNGETEFIGTPTDTSSRGSHDDPSPSSSDSILNPTSSTSADAPSAGLLDLPSPELMSTVDEWSRLPDVLVQQVLSLCGILDLQRLRAVCKRWNSLICAPHCGQKDARYIIGRCFDGNRLFSTKVVGWKIYDLMERRWHTWKPEQHYSNQLSEAGMTVLCEGTTMAAANDHPLASDGGLVLCCSMLPAGTAIISELIITNPMAMTKELVLPLPMAWYKLHLSNFAVNLVVDRLSYKLFLINRYEDPFLHIFDSTINQWRISSNPPVRAWDQVESVTFQGHLYVLCRAKEPPRGFWLLRYNYQEDSWADCGVNFPEWPENGLEHKELVVSGNRLFVISGDRLHLDTSNDRVIRMLAPLAVFEINLGERTLVTECQFAKPLFDAEGLKVEGQSFSFFDPQFEEDLDVKSFDFHRAFGFGTSIMLTYRWLAFSIVYNLETCLWKLFPMDPNILLYGNAMPLVSHWCPRCPRPC